MTDLLRAIVLDAPLLQKAVLSGPSSKNDKISRIDIRPILLSDELFYQAEERRGTQVLHKNLTPAELAVYLEKSMVVFKNGALLTPERDYYIIRSKKGKLTIIKKPPSMPQPVTPMPHNRARAYTFVDGDPEPFLVQLGIMEAAGRVKPAWARKFVQINRFVELMSDTLATFGPEETIEAVDFGCGKAYLTFAIQAALERQGLYARVCGVDLKQEVLAECTEISGLLGLVRTVTFSVGTIDSAPLPFTPNMVVALHACDTATDDAIIRAVAMDTKVLLLAPCCQHEMHKILENKTLDPILRYGVQRDKLATLVTDTLRVLALEAVGYKVDMLEFTPAEHTAKNVMIRAVAGGKREAAAKAELKALLKEFGITESYLLKGLALEL